MILSAKLTLPMTPAIHPAFFDPREQRAPLTTIHMTTITTPTDIESPLTSWADSHSEYLDTSRLLHHKTTKNWTLTPAIEMLRLWSDIGCETNPQRDRSYYSDPSPSSNFQIIVFVTVELNSDHYAATRPVSYAFK
jgi:hypothetical protein